MSRRTDAEEISVSFDEILRDTGKAVLLDLEDRQEWFPKSQVHVDDKTNSVTMPEWLAREKGFV